MHEEEMTETDHGCVVLYAANIMANLKIMAMHWVSRRLINAMTGYMT
jgi:hypothetical protein